MENENTNNAVNTNKRPKWVWVITITFVLSSVYTVYSIYAVKNGLVSLDEAQKEYFARLGFIDWGISAITALLNVTAAITLFMLKKITVKIWAAAVTVAIFSHVYSLLFTNYFESMPASGVIGAFTGLLIVIAIYFYTRRLNARGVLS